MHEPSALAAALRRVRGSRDNRVSSRSSPTSVTRELDRAARRAARASLRARRPALAIRAKRQLPAVGHLALSTRRPASASRSTLRTAACARASPESSASASARGGARPAPSARRSRGALDRRGLAPRTRASVAMSFASPAFLLALLLVPLGLAAHPGSPNASEAARRSVHGRAGNEAGSFRACRRGAGTSRQRWRSPPSRRWGLRLRSHSARSPCQWNELRSCSSPTTRGRCSRPTSSRTA